MKIEGYQFEFVCELSVQQTDEGLIQLYTPQQRYEQANSTYVHQYGWGAFCRFRIHAGWEEVAGVYIR